VSVEAGQIVRAALQAWVTSLQLTPETQTVAVQPEVGDRPALPHIGLAWGPVTSSHERLELIGVDEDVDDEPSPATWRAGYDEVQARFMLRATSAEDADWLAHSFRSRFAIEAERSNDGGDPVLHFDVELGGAERVGKVYLDGTFNPPAPADVESRSLYVQSLGAIVVYPRFAVEELVDGTGQMTVSVEINGVEYAVPQEEEEA